VFIFKNGQEQSKIHYLVAYMFIVYMTIIPIIPINSANTFKGGLEMVTKTYFSDCRRHLAELLHIKQRDTGPPELEATEDAIAVHLTAFDLSIS
jgi:hypothetical protein